MAATSPSPDEIIVVADGDTDGSWRVAEAAGTKVIRLEQTGGPAKARNLGAAQASGDILLFIDADTAVPVDVVSRVIAVFEENPDLAALIGSYDDEPGMTDFLSQYKNLLHHFIHQTSSEEAWTFWGACGAVRSEVFSTIGGFNGDFRDPSIEDIELGYRLRKAGYRIKLVKSIQVKHLKRWGAASLLKTDFFHRALPWTDLILRERLFLNDLNLKHSHRISVAAAGGLVIAVGAAFWSFWSLAAAGIFIAILILLNLRLYVFFYKKRGFWFTLKALPWHWFYYFYSGLAFALGLVIYKIKPGDK